MAEFKFRVFGQPAAQPRSNIRVWFPSFEKASKLWERSRGLKQFMGLLRGSTTGQVYVPKDHRVNQWKLDVQKAARPMLRVKITDKEIMYFVGCIFIFPRIQDLDKKGVSRGRHFRGTRNDDNDNLEKAVWDAITALGFWVDDGKVVHNETQKFYAAHGELPGAEITIRTITKAAPVPDAQASLF